MTEVKSLSRIVHIDYFLDDAHEKNTNHSTTLILNPNGPIIDFVRSVTDTHTVTVRRFLRRFPFPLMLLMLVALVTVFPRTALAAPDDHALVGTIAYNRVNLRSGPSTRDTIIAKLSAGTEVTLLARERDWYQLHVANEIIGWVRGDLIRISPEVRARVPATGQQEQGQQPAAAAETTPAATHVSRGDVASFARQLEGARYAWGGAGPKSFDCSGLTRYVYQRFGVHLPHSSRAQYSSRYGSFVPRGAIQPGDLIFFANTAGRGITHVGIYLGDERFIHAMSPGRGVQISNLYNSYWSRHYYGALRPYR